MIYLFCFFGGMSNSFINLFVRTKGKLKYDICETRNNNEQNKILTNLKKDGYYKSSFLSDDKLNLIKKKILLLEGKYDDDNLKDQKKTLLDLNVPKSVRYKYDCNDLIKIPEIQDIIVNQEILKVAESYLGSIPIIEYCESWWSFPSDKPDHNAAQLWHFDMDRPKFLKVFFFLNDCNTENGAHMFIKKTHKNFGIPLKIRLKNYTRLSDDLINQYFNKDEIIEMKTEAGDILFEDTSGLHKGQRLKKGNRLTLVFQYSSCLFGSVPKKIHFPPLKTDKLNNCIEKNKKLFSNFY